MTSLTVINSCRDRRFSANLRAGVRGRHLMAKRRGSFSRDAQRSNTADDTAPRTSAAQTRLGAVEEKILDFSEDLGRLLGTAQRKASEWMGQRQTVLKQLQAIRSTADQLLHELTGSAQAAVAARGRKGGR